MRRSISMVPLVMAGVLAGAFIPSRPSADEVAIRATVQKYFDGLVKFDAPLLAQAFDSTAMIMSAPRGRGLRRIPFPEWVKFTNGEAPAPADYPRYKNQILSVDIGGNAASVKTDLEWPGVHYVDYLSLLKVGEEWKIVNKIWWGEPRP